MHRLIYQVHLSIEDPDKLIILLQVIFNKGEGNLYCHLCCLLVI